MTDFVKIAFMREILDELALKIQEKVEKIWGIKLNTKDILDLNIKAKGPQKQEIIQSVYEDVAEAFTQAGLNFSMETYKFVMPENRTRVNLWPFLEKADIADIKKVFFEYQAEIFKKAKISLLKVYEDILSKYKCDEKTFSYLMQSSTGKPSRKYDKYELAELFKSIIDTGKTPEEASEIIKGYQTSINSKIASATTVNDQGHFKEFLVKRAARDEELKQALSRQFENGTLETILLNTLDDKVAKLKILEITGMGQNRFPLSASRAWPDIDKRNESAIYELIAKCINMERPQRVGLVLGSKSSKTEDPNAIKRYFDDQGTEYLKHFFLVKLEGNKEKFLTYVKNALLDQNKYSEEEIDYFIEKAIEFSVSDPRLRNGLFPDYMTHDSIEEANIVAKINEEFGLRCVQSRMTFPISNDFSLNKDHFIVDFIIYCDTVEGISNLKENGANYQMPDIRHEVILVGEYYGGSGANADNKAGKPLAEDLLYPDGTVAFEAGTQLTHSMVYDYKTEYKKIVEEFCSRMIGCKTLSIGKGGQKQQSEEIREGLDSHQAIYRPTTIPLKPDAAVNKLIEWYKNADGISKQKSAPLLSRYIDINNLMPRPGREYEYDKYTVLIQCVAKHVMATELTYAIQMTDHKNFNMKTLLPLKKEIDRTLKALQSHKSIDNQMNEIRDVERSVISNSDFGQKIMKSLQLARRGDEWRFEALDELQTTVNQYKKNGWEISTDTFMKYINKIKDKSTTARSIEGGVDLSENADVSVDEFAPVERTTLQNDPLQDFPLSPEAFNLHKFIKRSSQLS